MIFNPAALLSLLGDLQEQNQALQERCHQLEQRLLQSAVAATSGPGEAEMIRDDVPQT